MPGRRRVDVRYYIIALLVVCAAALGYYRWGHPAPGARLFASTAAAEDADPSQARLRAIIDTTARVLGAPRKFIAVRAATDSGRSVPEIAIGVPSAFDDLRMIGALTDSLKVYGWSVSAMKSLKEKTTTIRLRDRRHQCMYRCCLYRKELSH